MVAGAFFNLTLSEGVQWGVSLLQVLEVVLRFFARLYGL
jgi:hypothetical protein